MSVLELILTTRRKSEGNTKKTLWQVLELVLAQTHHRLRYDPHEFVTEQVHLVFHCLNNFVDAFKFLPVERNNITEAF